MKQWSSRVSSKGQIVIPADLRSEMSLKPGTRVSLERDGDTLILRPITWEAIDKLYGSSKGLNLAQAREREHRKERF